MTKQPRLLSATVTLTVGAAWLFAASCGGRALTGVGPDGAAVNQPDGSSGGAGQGAAGHGSAGQGSAGNATGQAGAGDAPGTGGVGGAAGTSAVGQGGAGGAPCGPCPSAVCKTGFTSVIDPAVSCCPICRPVDCLTIMCAPVPCPSGSHIETPDGQCCPTCQPGPVPSSCLKGQAAYDQQRTQLIEKYTSQPCMVDTDCTLVPEDNACVSRCGTAFPTSLASNAQSNLDASATMACGTCPPPPKPPCIPLVAFCSNGRCVSGPTARPDAGPAGCTTNTGQDLVCGQVGKPGHYTTCVAPYTPPSGCALIFSNSADHYCCP